MSKNAANEDEENFSGLKSILPIKINGSYLGSNEKIDQINCLDQSIKERRRSLRERTPIKISGTQFIRDLGDIENDPSLDSISVTVPFGQISYEAQPFSNKMRFIPPKKSSQDFIENFPENKSSTSEPSEGSFENVIHNMKNTLKSLKTNVTCKTLAEINREVTPCDLPDLDPLSEDVDQTGRMAAAVTTSEIDGRVPSLKPLINTGGGKQSDSNITTFHNISTHPSNIDIDLHKIQTESQTPGGAGKASNMKYSMGGGQIGKTGRNTSKKSSFKNTISYLLSKALDDYCDSDSESEFSENSSISSSVEKSFSRTSVRSEGEDATSVTEDLSFDDDVLTDRTSTTDCLDTESYSWYFDLEANERNKHHLEANRFNNVPGAKENGIKLTGRTTRETSCDVFSSNYSIPPPPSAVNVEETCEKPLPGAGSPDTGRTENQMRLDVTGFNLILQRSVQSLSLS